MFPKTKHTVNNEVPINIELKPTFAKRYSVGAGYGTFTGPRINLAADYARIGARGQHLKFRLKLSRVLKRLSTEYFIPGHDPLTEKYVLGAHIEKFVPDNGESTLKGLSVSKIINLNDWHHTISLKYLDTRYRVENDPSETSRALYPDYTVSWVKSNDLINPSFATSISIGIRGATEHIISFTNFIQADIKAKQIFSPTKYSKVILRGSLGYTLVNDLSVFPLTLRYFTGGINSIRGYDYSSIGPGKYLETASIELQHKLVGNISGAVFYDIGTATDHFNDTLKKSVGVGLIYNSIVGPVRFYAAKPLADPGTSLGFEFSIGPEF